MRHKGFDFPTPSMRYFLEITAAAKSLRQRRLVLDGELMIPAQPFDALQARLHPAPSRIEGHLTSLKRHRLPSTFCRQRRKSTSRRATRRAAPEKLF
jgi:hypothetical protein